MRARSGAALVAGTEGAVAERAPWLAPYVALTKPRVVSLLVLTGACAAVVGAGGRADATVLAAVVGGGGLAAGGANALNCALDRDLDALMARTRDRPLPRGRVPTAHAVALGLALNALAALWLVGAANVLAAVLALAGSAWYVVVYTWWLKRRSPQNIVIGGAAGCFPPLVGWAAATGTVDGTALALAAVVFLWTPVHFWALATLLREDYRRAGVPMLPVVAPPTRVARLMLGYAVATALASLSPVAWGGLGLPYLVVALAGGVGLVRRAWAHRRRPGASPTRGLYRYSLAYVAGLFVTAALERMAFLVGG